MKDRKLLNAVVVAYGRTAIGRSVKGSLAEEHPVEYASQVIKGILKKVPGLDLEEIDDVVVGCAKPEGVQTSNIGRVIAQRSGLPDAVSGHTVNRFCSSGLQAIATAANTIMVGQAEVVIAGGVENMTMLPMGNKPEFRDKWVEKNRPGVYLPMGITAENVAKAYGVSRIEMEEFALESHQKAYKAQSGHLFEKEIVPIVTASGKVFNQDECIRPDTTMEKMASLKPSFCEDGLVTAAVSSPTSDGAGFVILMSEEKAAELHIKPIARFVAFAVAGVAAEIMGTGPMKAVPKVMKQAGLTIDDMDVIELNEAFAAQAVPCIRELGLDKSKVNPRGGAIAMGHPLGATGAILTCKALSYLEDTGGRYGLVTMCVGGGMGAAGIFERIS